VDAQMCLAFMFGLSDLLANRGISGWSASDIRCELLGKMGWERLIWQGFPCDGCGYSACVRGGFGGEREGLISGAVRRPFARERTGELGPERLAAGFPC